MSGLAVGLATCRDRLAKLLREEGITTRPDLGGVGACSR